MKQPLKGLDYFRASDELKEKTRKQIIAKQNKPKQLKTSWKTVIAASVAVVMIGGSAFAVLQNNSLFGSRNSGIDGNGTNGYGDGFEPGVTGDFTTETEDAPETGGGTEATTGTPDTVPDAMPGEAAPTVSKAARPNGQKPTAGLLTAKHWNDNLNFDFWLNLIGQDSAFRQYQDNWETSFTKRITVTVQNGQTAIGNAVVTLLDNQGNTLWTAVSDNKGKAYLFYSAFRQTQQPAKVKVSYRGRTVEKQLEQGTNSYTIGLSGAKKQSTALDLMFVCDTTGSMGDELSYLQQELQDIIKQVKNKNGNIPFRLSVNFYRDKGDQYITKPFPFTTDTDTVVRQLKEQTADGGGDFEEAVEQALKNAIHDHEWAKESTAKLLFLILDAPPHSSAKAEMQAIIKDAAALGIRIIPVAASGIDGNTEYLLRTLGLATGGSYVTLTDDSGIGGSHLEPTIGKSKVYPLNELLLQIINGYLS